MSANRFNYGQRPKAEKQPSPKYTSQLVKSSPLPSNDGGAAATSPDCQNRLQQPQDSLPPPPSQPAAGGWGRSQGSPLPPSQPAASGGGWDKRPQRSPPPSQLAAGGWGERQQRFSPPPPSQPAAGGWGERQQRFSPPPSQLAAGGWGGRTQSSHGNSRDYPIENKVYVGNLPPNGCTSEQLRRVFMPLRLQVVDIYINHQNHYAFVTFSNPDEATRAIAEVKHVFVEADESYEIRVDVMREQSTFKAGGGEAVSFDRRPAAGGGTAEPPRRNQFSLFSNLLTIGRGWGIENSALIGFLKMYTSQPDILPFAENRPNEKQLQAGITEMKRVLPFPGKTLFESVLAKGISPETIGSNAFAQFVGHNSPPGYMWAFRECPHIKVVQSLMCFRNCGNLTDIGVFIAGMLFNPDGRVSFFKQNMSRNYAEPSYPVGMMAVMWICRVGHYVHLPDYAFEGETAKGLDALYDPSGNFHGGTAAVGAMNEADNRYANGVVPQWSDHLRHGEADKILADPHFHDACQKAMTKRDGIPVSMCSIVVHQNSTEADSDDEKAALSALSALSAPSAPSESYRICKHGKFFIDDKSSCEQCLRDGGKSPIKNGWGNIIGYRE